MNSPTCYCKAGPCVSQIIQFSLAVHLIAPSPSTDPFVSHHLITVADVCPRVGCHMPLMRSRQGRVVCCTCRADIVTTQDATPRSNGPTTPVTDATDTSLRNGPPTAAKADVDPHGDKPSVTKEGAKADAQEDALVTKDATTTRTEGTSDSVKTPIADSRAIVATTPAGRGAAAERTARDAMSAALGDKLLAGWTLLAESCAQCATPLVGNTDGRVQCVACAVPRREAASATALSTSTVAGGGAGGVVPAAGGGVGGVVRAGPSHAVVQGDTGASGRRVAMQGLPRRADVKRNVPALEAAPVTAVTSLDDAATCTDEDVDRELRLAEQASAVVLRVLRERLADVSDAHTQMVLCSGMTEAANAIAASRKARQTQFRVV